MSDDAQWGRRLRAIRLRRGLTLSAAAEGLPMAFNTLSRLETGNKRLLLSDALILAERYGVSLSDIVDTGMPEPMIWNPPRASTRRRRREMTPEFLAEVAEAWNRAGDIADVMALGGSQASAYRWKALAVEAGLIERDSTGPA